MPHAQTDVLPSIIAEDHHDVPLFHPMRHPDGDMNDCTGRDARKDPLFRCQILRGRKGATGINHNLAVQQAGVKDRRDEALVQAAKPLNQIARGVSWMAHGVDSTPNKKTIRSLLDAMRGLHMLVFESNAFNTRITICNWSTYQKGTSVKVTDRGTANGRQEQEVQEVPPVIPPIRTAKDDTDNGRIHYSVNQDPDFTADPAFSPNALLTLWRDSKLPLPRSIDQLSQEDALRRLHHNPPHWPAVQIRQAIDKLIADHRGQQALRWAWIGGPSYLAKQKPGEPQGIEKVLGWEPFGATKGESTHVDGGIVADILARSKARKSRGGTS
ncbi:MAG: hypothetical protein HW385_1227 [candidate division NC10 bacterium]|nr:hypothetical protein [candidate division NC10 bacterium]